MPTVTLSELQQYVYERLEENTVLYSATQVTNAINETYRICNIACGINQATVSVPGFSVANQYLYPTPKPILFPLTVAFEGRTLRKSSVGALTRKFVGWATDSTAKSGSVQRWAPIGINQFIIHPYDSLGGRDIAVTGVTEPTPLAKAADTISVEDEYVTMIVEGTSHRLQLLEGGKAFADSSSLMLQSFYRRMKLRAIFNTYKAPKYWILTGPAQ